MHNSPIKLIEATPLVAQRVETVHDSFMWGRDAFTKLLDGNIMNWDQLLFCMTDRKLLMSDSYSGICANVTADSYIKNAAGSFVAGRDATLFKDSVDAIEFDHLYSVEIKAKNRAEIIAHPDGPDCVFTNLLDFCEKRHRRACGLDGGKELRADELEALLPRSSVILDGFCERHNRICRMKSADGHTAGHTCVDHSAMGRHAGKMGKHMKVFFIFVALRRRLKEKVLWLENVLSFGITTIEKHLGDLYFMVRVETSPLSLGWQVERKRQIVVCFLKAII